MAASLTFARRACVLLSPFVIFCMSPSTTCTPPLPRASAFLIDACVCLGAPCYLAGGPCLGFSPPSPVSLKPRLAPGCPAGTHTSSHLAAEEESTPTLRCRALAEPSQGHCGCDTFPCQTPPTSLQPPPPLQFHTQINRQFAKPPSLSV